MRLSTALIVLLTPGFGPAACTTARDCERQLEAARRDAVRDAEACRFEITPYLGQTCANGDDQPRNAWLSVFCGRATISCLRANASAEAACFGGPDTGLIGES